MSKLYIFGIGGTGARVLRSLTMLMASGVSLGDKIDTVVPVIIDPDSSNGDLTRTVSLMQLYQKIRAQLSFDNRPGKEGYFKVQIDDMGTNFRLHLNNVANMKFADYIAYNRFPSEGKADSNQALLSLLFSDSNLACGYGTFICDDIVRDRYDVYTYANLHVPMGSQELYAAANDWRYFNKIKEDMQVDGNVYYVNLTVQQGTTGHTRQAMKSDERYTIYIGSVGDYKVNSVSFDGEDVTDDIVNGYYTTPLIKNESVLSISYEVTSSNSSMMLEKVRVIGYDNEINIYNIDEPSDVSVFTADGKLVDNRPSSYGSVKINVMPNNLYVVKVGNNTYKVAL